MNEWTPARTARTTRRRPPAARSAARLCRRPRPPRRRCRSGLPWQRRRSRRAACGASPPPGASTLPARPVGGAAVTLSAVFMPPPPCRGYSATPARRTLAPCPARHDHPRRPGPPQRPQPTPACHHPRLAAGVGAQHAQGRPQVALDCLHTQAQALGGDRVRGAGGHAGQDVDFAGGQLDDAAGVGGCRGGALRQEAARVEEFRAQGGVADPRGQGAQSRVGLAHLLPGGTPVLVRRRPGRLQQPPHLLPHHQRLLHVPSRRHGRRQRAVAERLGRAQGAVQDTAHPAPYDDRDRQHRTQTFRGDRCVVLVGDLPGDGVVRDRAGAGEGDGLAAQAVAGRHRESAQGLGRRAVQFADAHPRAPRLHHAAEGDRQSRRAAQAYQRAPHLHRCGRVHCHVLALSPLFPERTPPFGGSETHVTDYTMTEPPGKVR